VIRPHHSFEGFRRYIQMSGVRFFTLVEGKEIDPYFYGEIVRPPCAQVGLVCELVRADRVAPVGGKDVLISLHNYLEASGSLVDQTEGVTSYCMFYLDKDVDDILGRMIESPHITYTRLFSVENEIFVRGDVAKAAAVAASLPLAEVRKEMPDAGQWRRGCAEAWTAFVVFCLFSCMHRVACDCTYRQHTSPINAAPENATDEQAARERKTDMRRRSGLQDEEFEREFQHVQRLVQEAYLGGRHDEVFNGKWYAGLLLREVDRMSGGDFAGRHGFINAVRGALIATVSFDGEWADHFRGPVRALIGPEAGAAQAQ
jgi:hypothetical protein